MNSVFSALSGVIDDRCFLNRQPAIENELSDFDVVIGIARMTLAIFDNFGYSCSFFFQKIRILSSVQPTFWNRFISSASVDVFWSICMCLLSNVDTSEDEDELDCMLLYDGDSPFSQNSIEYNPMICSITWSLVLSI